MEKDMIINQVRLVYDYAYAELEKSVKGHTLIESNTLDQIVAGLWLIVKDTLGESWSLKNKVEFDDNCEAPCEESGDDVPAVEHDDAPMPDKRYCGEAMIKSDLVRLSKYDLRGLDFKVSVYHVGWKDDPHRGKIPVWKAYVEFLRDDRTSSCGFFMFNDAGSVIDNSVKAFDRMVDNSPSVFGFLKEKPVECEKSDDDFTAKFDKQTGKLVIKHKGPDYVNVDFVAEKSNKEAEAMTHKSDEAEIFGYPVADWKRVLDENSVDCPGKLAAFLEGFEKYRKVMRNHGIKNGQEELDERLSILDEKQSEHKEKEA